ncbi:MAG TPA: MarR family transcriptional regulator [Treponemataceae bacterium]|nr:MarR family transcriptional regulator [Treponemataceae bacterium]HPS43972.1 MarR family transcriptional regulator [Treponemataceae bacterium]
MADYTEGDFHRLLARTFRMHAKRSHGDLAEIGISHGQPRVLHYLSEHDGCIQKEIADTFDLEPATVTDILSIMEKGGLIERKNDPADRRALRVYLTPKGAVTHGKVEAIFARVEREAFAGFTGADKRQAFAVLARLYENLKRAEEGSNKC